MTSPPIVTKRIHAPAEPRDGLRVLVDRLWPRGIAKEQAQIDAWPREIAPSDGLRRWFAHDASRWPEFVGHYFAELELMPIRVGELISMLPLDRKVTFLFAAQDTEHNNAVALKAYVERRIARSLSNSVGRGRRP